MLFLISTQANAYLLDPLLECENSKTNLIVKLESKNTGTLHVGRNICPFEVTKSMDSPRSVHPTVNLFLKPKKNCHPELFLEKGFMKLSVSKKKNYHASVLILKENQTLSCEVKKSKKNKLFKLFFTLPKALSR